ncbi:clathrin light chain-like isoform X1 [Dermacentor andersoni]|uniref:clathrin light chain-like isoform X1 n=1 Tax=Dermacentor andersoni TaxID=34620 RepID=UPI002155A1F7|nr:clathrin light chain-like isoform X1 [Dermacentor andersoni]
MADFDQFEASFDNPPVTEEDPAAEFLAREQDVLAGLEDDNFDGVPVPQQQPTVDGLADDVAAEVQMNGPSQPPTVVPDTSPRPTPVREEPEKIKKWREEQAKRLEQKDVEEEEKKTELRANAKKELEEWYARYHEQIEKAKLANREVSKNAEKEWVHERDSPAPKGQEWEAIAKLCDFNPKAARNSKDVSRMRSIILQLKQSPPQTNKTP